MLPESHRARDYHEAVSLRRTVIIVAVLNLAYFGVELYFGTRFSSVALVADSVDFFEDASVNILIAFAIGWRLAQRRMVAYFLAFLLLVPGAIFLWSAINQVLTPTAPEGLGMGLVGLGALFVNVFCALLVARHRTELGGLVMAAFYSARNDAIANILIVVAGLITLAQPSIWPDLVVGITIFVLNADAAIKIVEASKRESKGRA